MLYKQSSNSFTYTATKDCVLCGLISATSQGVPHFYLDNKEILAPYIAISGTFSLPIFMPIKKGQTVEVGSNLYSTNSPLTFYKILK